MDLNAIKSRLNQLQNQTSTKENFWKPEPGKTQVRIVPYKHNKDNPFIELYFHYLFQFLLMKHLNFIALPPSDIPFLNFPSPPSIALVPS